MYPARGHGNCMRMKDRERAIVIFFICHAAEMSMRRKK
jgi:hypothetical protein